MAGSKQKIIETLQSVDTVLITVGKSPSVDELSAALGLTIFLNESGKHATAVMSGDIPPAISFLEPEKTFENSVDSLRDFVIALDKDKADHLRYKLVDDVVKIFITPYRSVITEKDLKYSKGDYNVELVIAIGVKTREDLDKALSSHGRILHDATVVTVGHEESKLGDPDWYSKGSSSLSEMVASLISNISTEDKKMDKRVASALLTGIVSATDRFSNDRTSPESLNVAAELMSYGANQQLIALKLREGSKMDIQPEDGSKKLTHDIDKNNRKQNSNKKQKNREKDKTKFSIDHKDSEPRDQAGDRGKRSDKNRQRDQQDNKPKEETPVETTAPNRIGLGEDGQYDPVAALDEALKISEKKRVEDNNDDKDKLAEELARSLEQSQQSQQVDQPEEAMPFELMDTGLPQPTEGESTDVYTSENTPQVVEQSTQPQAESFQSDQVAQPESEAPQMKTDDSSSLPPVQQPSDIGEVRQTNTPTKQDDPVDGPTFGGVLNATTESAAEAKKLAESEIRNRTILNRSTPGAPSRDVGNVSTPPPFNSTMAGGEDSLTPSFDINAPQQHSQVFEPAGNNTYQNQTMVPPTPTGTLEEIDRQHRQSQPPNDTEVRDMFEPSSQPLPTPSVPIGQPSAIQAPNTPPPPPMPDFSQLPPLPTQMPDFSQVPAQMPPDAPDPGPDNLGQILPPAPPSPQQGQQSNDPGQFQIPTQQ